MNLLTCTSRDVKTAAAQAALPAARTSPRKSGDPARVLFINGAELGFATTARSLEHYTAQRGDIEAVHFSAPLPTWFRAVCAETPNHFIKFSGLDFHAMRMMLGTRVLLERMVRRHLRPERFDAIHIMTQQRAMMASRLRRSTGAKIIVNSDATHAGWDRAFEYHRLAPTPQIGVERRIFQACDAVACASRWVADSIESDYGVARGKLILHMPCARRIAGMSPRAPDAHQKRGVGSPLRIVFVGNDWVRKGGPRLLAWHQQRWADKAELHVCSARAPVDRSCRNVIWHGAVEHDRLIREVLPTMDLFVMPTIEDTFLIAAQEAQSVGVPVVTSRLAGIPEVVLHERTGLLCRRDDDAGFIAAVERLMNDPALLARYSGAAAAHAAADLNADVWHNHLLDQIVALVEGRSVKFEPGQHTAG